MLPLAGSTPASLNDPAGTWVGQWERDGSTLEVEVVFKRTSSGYEGSFSSVQLRVVGIPFREIRYEEPRLSWELVGDSTTTVFDGTVQGDTLAGRFHEGDARGTFRLSRATRAATRLEEEEVTFRNGPVTLGGAVIYPSGSGPFPGVVFLHGSDSGGGGKAQVRMAENGAGIPGSSGRVDRARDKSMIIHLRDRRRKAIGGRRVIS